MTTAVIATRHTERSDVEICMHYVVRTKPTVVKKKTLFKMQGFLVVIWERYANKGLRSIWNRTSRALNSI